MDKQSSKSDEILGILTEFAVFDDNRIAMVVNGVANEVVEVVKAGSSAGCEFITAMALNLNFLEEILALKIYEILIDLVMQENFEWKSREKFLACFQKLINLQGLTQLIEISNEISKNFSKILKISPPLAISQNLISIFEKLALYSEMKDKISASGELANAIFASISLSTRSSTLVIRLLNLIATFIDQVSFRRAFVEFCACEFLQYYLKSSAFQLRASACNLINMAANYSELCTEMVNEGILKTLSDNFECSLCSDGFERMLNMDLSMKFAIRRRLDVNDKIKSGFFASKGKIDFMVLRKVMQSEISSPFRAVYVINFDEEIKMGKI